MIFQYHATLLICVFPKQSPDGATADIYQVNFLFSILIESTLGTGTTTNY